MARKKIDVTQGNFLDFRRIKQFFGCRHLGEEKDSLSGFKPIATASQNETRNRV